MTVKYSLKHASHFLFDLFYGEVLAAILAPEVLVGDAYPLVGVPCLPLVAVADELGVGLFVD